MLEFLFSFWTILDVLNISLIVYTFCYRYWFQSYVLQNPVDPFSPKLNKIFQESHEMQEHQLVVNGVSILLCILRFFSYYRFQEKLNVLTLTFRYASTDLYHFCLQLFGTFILMAIIGYFLFGSTNFNYSSIGMSLTSVLEMVVNNYDLPKLRRGSDLADAYMIFVSVFIAQIWLGCLMAILMNHFSAATAPSEEEEEVGGGSTLRTRGGKFTVAEQVIQGLEKTSKRQKTLLKNFFHKNVRKFKSHKEIQTDVFDLKIRDEVIADMCQAMQDQGKVDFSFEEGVEELLKLVPDLDGDGNITEEDKVFMMRVIKGKRYLFIQSEPEFQNEQGFVEDVSYGDEVLFSEVELLQQENLRLRSMIKKNTKRVEEALNKPHASGGLMTVGKFKRGFLRKKGGNRGGKDWIENGSFHSPGVGWKWRWFMMTPRYLAYYVSSSASQPAFVLNFADMRDIGIDVLNQEQLTARASESADAGDGTSGYTFYIRTDTARLEILCSDPQERADWLKALSQTIQLLLNDEQTRNYYTEESRIAEFRTKREKKSANPPAANKGKTPPSPGTTNPAAKDTGAAAAAKSLPGKTPLFSSANTPPRTPLSSFAKTASANQSFSKRAANT
jgi:hypothetical protein